LSRKASAASSARRKWLRRSAILAIVLLVIPIVQVGWVRFFTPAVTPLMLLRKWAAKMDGKHSHEIRYSWIDRRNLPPEFIRLALASEDQRFFQHHGFDWREIAVSQRDAIRTGQPARGASTITQQCARSLFLWQGRSWIRKGIEAWYALWMEVLLPKRRILELYANVIEMGDGVYGVGAAAQAHFGVPARELTRDQCALLVAILPDPRARDPRDPSSQLSSRARRILGRGQQVNLPDSFHR
jgi:monofunctional glycosyltransferase